MYNAWQILGILEYISTYLITITVEVMCYIYDFILNPHISVLNLFGYIYYFESEEKIFWGQKSSNIVKGSKYE